MSVQQLRSIVLSGTLAVACAAVACPALAQDATARVVGRVLTADGQPLPSVAVSVEGTDIEVRTGPDGGFTIANVPEGEVLLRAGALGFSTEERVVSVGGPDAPPVEIRLERSPIYLAPIVVTGTFDGRGGAEALRPSRSLSGRELERKLGVTLAQTLENEPGVSAMSMGPAPARPIIRGFGGDRILILEDGQRVGDVSSTSGDHAVATEGASAERIEVVRGPAALFYGSNAIGGVVNVVREEIPRSRVDDTAGSLALQAQSVYSGVSASGELSLPVGGLSGRLEGSVRRTGDVETPAGAIPNSGIRTWSTGAGLSRVDDWGFAGASVRAYSSEYGIPPDSVAGHPGGVDIRLDRTAVRGETEITRGVGPFEHLRLTAAYTTYAHDEIEGSGEIGTSFRQSGASVEVQGHNSLFGPFSSGGVGMRAEHRDYYSDNGRDVVDASELYLALFAVEEWQSGPLELQAGARLDYARLRPRNPVIIRDIEAGPRSFSEVSASVAALYEAAEGVRLGVSLARSVRTPSSEELFSQGPHLASYTFEVGNPELLPETAYGLDLFVRVNRPTFSGEVVGFVSSIDGFSFGANTGEQRGSLFVYRSINTDARFRGGEASFEWSPHRYWVVGASASAVTATDLSSNAPLPLIPPVNGRGSLRHERDRWFAEGSLTWAARQDRIPSRPEIPTNSPGFCDEVPPGDLCRPVPGDFVPTDGFVSIGASVGYRIVRGTAVHSLTLRVDNATDATYRNHLSRIKELAPEPGVGVSLIYRLGF